MLMLVCVWLFDMCICNSSRYESFLLRKNPIPLVDVLQGKSIAYTPSTQPIFAITITTQVLTSHLARSASPPAQGTRPIMLTAPSLPSLPMYKTAPSLPSLAMYKVHSTNKEERDTRRQKSTLVSYHEARVKSAGARSRSSDPAAPTRGSRPSSTPSRRPAPRPVTSQSHPPPLPSVDLPQ